MPADLHAHFLVTVWKTEIGTFVQYNVISKYCLVPVAESTDQNTFKAHQMSKVSITFDTNSNIFPKRTYPCPFLAETDSINININVIDDTVIHIHHMRNKTYGKR